MNNKKNYLIRRLHEIVFEADTRAGKIFDITLLFLILLSTVLIMLESVESINDKYGVFFINSDIIITCLFSLEYLVRIFIVKKPARFIFSFFGIVDLLAIAPSYLAFFFPFSHNLVVIRSLRLLRVFRILKLSRYSRQALIIREALLRSKEKILVFLVSIITLIIILGTIMYIIEGGENGFTSIPRSVYWAIVTLTTVGYGDISPHTEFGQFVSSIVMIIGYVIIAVPTGIVSVEISKSRFDETKNTQACPNCMNEKHINNAVYCHKCGGKLN